MIGWNVLRWWGWLVPFCLMVGSLHSCAAGEQPYFDDFSDTRTRWAQSEDALGITNYQDGKYRIRVDEPDYYLWSLAGQSYTDVRVEVQIQIVEAVEGGEAGVICRFQDENNFYFFIIHPNASFSAHRMLNGENQLMYLGHDESIHSGTDQNLMRVDCAGDRLLFYVNDSLLVEIEDNRVTQGDVGLIAGTNEFGGMDVLFDDFSTQPMQGK